MRHGIAVLCLLLLLPLSGQALAGQQAKDPPKDVIKIDGVWTMTVSSPMGERTNDATFKVENGKLKVTMEGPEGALDCVGTLKDAAIEWTMNIETPNGTFSLVFGGKVDGDKMSGEVGMGDFGTAAWSAVRKK